MTTATFPLAETCADESVRRQIARATRSLSRYRMSRDRARMERLRASPQLARAIAAVLAERS